MKRLALVLALLPLAASAATITVNTARDNIRAGDGTCTLREAIANVNAAADTTRGDCVAGSGTGDTITFSVTLPAAIVLRRPLSISQDVTITGPGSDLLAIDGRHRMRVFHITTGSTSMSGLTITNGRTRGLHAHGGGVLVENGALLALTDCTLSGNTAKALRGRLGYDAAGGGIAVYGTAILTNCTVSGNTVNYGYGGGIQNEGTVTLTNCTVSGNTATFGGGINNSGTATLTNCTLSGNSTPEGFGGGGGMSNLLGTATLTNCTVSGNSTPEGDGGGIFNYQGTMTLTNCTLSGNSTPEGDGGGMSNLLGTATLTNCTVSGNTAAFGGGIDNMEFIDVNPPTEELLNTIVAINRPNDCAGYRPTSNGHNMDSDGSCVSSGTDLTDANPQLAPIGNYGGVTQMLALCTGPGVPDSSCTGVSSAIDAGDDSVTGPPNNLSTDQRGLPRSSGAHVDIGAYEVQQ